MAASRLPIANDANGKPFLVGMTGCHFNVSHSEDWALVAIDVAGEVGVDIEMLRSIDGALGLAQSHFTTEELGTFVTLCDDVRDAAFLRAWTRKEACLKAIGTGLRVAPNTVATGLGAETMCVPFELATGRVLVDVRSIELRADCIAAVARVRGTLAPSSLVLRCGEPM